MRENKGPSINLKNINFINSVEKYEKSRVNKSPRIFDVKSKSIKMFDNAYINKRIYMMENKMLESFKKLKGIPAEDRKVIEKEFGRELKSLKLNLTELKLSRNKLYMENNAIYYKIESINNELQVNLALTIERRG
jgi:hypothetical protein